ncbi:hypothetical protein DFH28DRAFT_864185, partial [Melampsora americana]
LTSDIQHLEDIGAVSRMNQMSIEEIIHPQDKLQNQWELWTPEELFLQNQEDVVMIAAAEIEEANAEPTSDAVEVVRPTTKDALNHMCQLMLYLEIDDSSMADALDVLLGKYSAQVCSKLMLTAQQSSITDFF